MRYLKLLGSGLYLGVALATFGYAANINSRTEWAQYSVCSSAIPERICEEPKSTHAAIVGLFSAALWPLYLSWDLAERTGGQV